MFLIGSKCTFWPCSKVRSWWLVVFEIFSRVWKPIPIGQNGWQKSGAWFARPKRQTDLRWSCRAVEHQVKPHLRKCPLLLQKVGRPSLFPFATCVESAGSDEQAEYCAFRGLIDSILRLWMECVSFLFWLPQRLITWVSSKSYFARTSRTRWLFEGESIMMLWFCLNKMWPVFLVLHDVVESSPCSCTRERRG